jgi:MFS superfamily sulfate permease-like transporter
VSAPISEKKCPAKSLRTPFPVDSDLDTCNPRKIRLNIFNVVRANFAAETIARRARCNVPAIEASGLRALEHTCEKFHRRGTHLVLSGVQPQPMKIMLRSGLVDRIGLDNICPNIDEALIRAQAILAGLEPAIN